MLTQGSSLLTIKITLHYNGQRSRVCTAYLVIIPFMRSGFISLVRKFGFSCFGLVSMLRRVIALVCLFAREFSCF